METRKQLSPTLDWDVKVQPLYTINDKYSGNKAIMRNDDNKVLGVVSENYKPFMNRELVRLCKSIEKSGNYKIEGYAEFRNGKLILAFIRNINDNLRISGLELEEYLVIGNSHDKSRQIYVGSSHTMTRCENQYYQSLELLKMKHFSNNRISESVVRSIRDSYETRRKHLYKNIEFLNSAQINRQLVDDLLVLLLQTERLFGHDATKDIILNSDRAAILRKSIERETRELGNTAFGLLNGVTYYTSHELKNNPANFGNSTGLAAELNSKAMEYCQTIAIRNASINKPAF